MRIECIKVGAIETNCYLVINDETKRCFIVDPGAEERKIVAAVSGQELRPSAILLTHGHFDHILVVNEMKARYGIPVIAGREEKELLMNSELNCSERMRHPYSVEADRLVSDGEALKLAGMNLKVIYTPGHTSGSVCYYCEEEKLLFSGDTLFMESVGRTDLPRGNSKQLADSLTLLNDLIPDETVIYPGHGPKTQMGFEKQNNFMLAQL